MFSFFEYLINFLENLYNTFCDVCVDILVWIINALLKVLVLIFEMLATLMPSLDVAPSLLDQFSTPHQAICWLTWFVPFDVLFYCVEFYGTLYMLKFSSGPILRFLKIVR